MELARLVQPVRGRVVLAHLRRLLHVVAAIMTPPLLVATIAGDLVPAITFAGIGLVAFAAARWPRPAEPPDLRRREALVVTALAYPSFALAGAVAFLPGAALLDACFEALSGFTTTGLSVLQAETLPFSLVFFRAWMQWLGGAGIVVLSLVLLPGSTRTAFRLAAVTGKSPTVIGSVATTVRIVAKIYAALTILAFAILLVAGTPAPDAICLALATLSTGGFAPHPGSIAPYGGAVAAAVVLFMCLGATAFPLYHEARRQGLRVFLADPQVRAGMLVLALAWPALVALGWLHDGAWLPGLFHAASALTTTGFSVTDPRDWSDGEYLLVILLMVVGGSAGSTAGGIKLYRAIVVARLARWTTLRMLLPEEAQLPLRYGSEAIEERELREIAGLVVMHVALVLFSALLLLPAGHGLAGSLFESASAAGTVGLSAGVTSADLPPYAKLVLMFEMWAGRLETVVVLGLLWPAAWFVTRREP